MRLTSGHWVALALLAAMVLLRALPDLDALGFGPLRARAADAMQALDPRDRRLGDPPILVVDIDEASLAALGQWPWPRATLARLVDRLSEAGAAIIAFDMFFPEPDRLAPERIVAALEVEDPDTRAALLRLPDGDALFAAALRRAGNVVLARAPVPPRPGARPQAEDTAARAVLMVPDAEQAAAEAAIAADPRQLLRNLPVLEAAAAGIGLVSLAPDIDGVVRRVPLVDTAEGGIWPSLSAEILRLAGGGTMAVSWRRDVGFEGVLFGGVRFWTDPAGQVRPRFGRYDQIRTDRYVGAADVLAGRVPAERIEGRVVLVGTSATGLLDIKATPLEAAVPGVDIHVQLLEMLLADLPFLAGGPLIDGAVIATTILVALLLIALLPRLGAGLGALVTAVFLAAVAVAAWAGWQHHDLVIDPVFPGVTLLLLYLQLTTFNFAREDAQRRQLHRAFDSYVAPALVRQITADPARLKPGGERRQMTFVFTDLAGFTSFTEKVEPDVLVSVLNRYLDDMCRIAMDHEGAIDKIVGDAVHVMFNAPLDQPDHAERAVRCALAMDAFGRAFQLEMQAAGHAFGETRIGVNTGPVVVGNFGGRRRFHYTAHGDPINTAARLEAVNKHLGTRTCVSAETAGRCPPDLKFRPIAILYLKGKSLGVEALEPLTAEQDTSPQMAEYRAAYALMKAGAPDGARRMVTLAETTDDPVARLHRDRIAAGESGVEIRMSEK